MPKSVTSINCPSCGAPLKKGSDTCAFCSSLVTLHDTAHDRKPLYALRVTSFDFSSVSKKLMRKIFNYYVAGWTDKYFSRLPAIIQVDTSREKLKALMNPLIAVFKETGAGISLDVVEYTSRLPLENRHCRRLLGDRLDDAKIRKRQNAISPVMIALSFFIAMLLLSAVPVIMKIAKTRSHDPERERMAIGFAVTPKATAILEEYAILIEGTIRNINASLYPPGEIKIRGNRLLESIYIDLDYETKKVKKITFSFSMDFTRKGFEGFAALFTAHAYGGGMTGSGSVIEKTKAEMTIDGAITHRDFTVSLLERHDPQDYMNYLLRKGVYADEKKPGKDEIIDVSDIPLHKRPRRKKPEVTGMQIQIRFTSLRQSLAREVYVRAINALKFIVETNAGIQR